MNWGARRIKVHRLAAIARFATLLLPFVIVACKSGPNPLDNRVFYQWDDLADPGYYEKPFPALNHAAIGDSAAFRGVTILDGDANIARPINWMVRRASYQKYQSFIEYVSPNEYSFSVFVREDKSCASWDDVIKHYKEDAKKAGAEIMGEPVPMATWNAQGREFVVRRRMRGETAAFSNMSLEYLLKGDKHYLLAQIVHQSQSPAEVSTELEHVMKTFQAF